MKTKVLLVLILTVVIIPIINAQESIKRFGIEFSTGISMATNK